MGTSVCGKLLGFYHSGRCRSFDHGYQPNQLAKCANANLGLIRHPDPVAYRWIEHPLRHFVRANEISRLKCTTKYKFLAVV
jgi:hypothetical protein